MSQASRQLRAALAALLLLVNALVPGLHSFYHAVEDAELLATPCASCEHTAGAADHFHADGSPANEHQHARGDDCGLCAVVQLGRDLLPGGAGVEALALEPSVFSLAIENLVRHCSERSLLPPARAPPVS